MVCVFETTHQKKPGSFRFQFVLASRSWSPPGALCMGFIHVAIGNYFQDVLLLFQDSTTFSGSEIGVLGKLITTVHSPSYVQTRHISFCTVDTMPLEFMKYSYSSLGGSRIVQLQVASSFNTEFWIVVKYIFTKCYNFVKFDLLNFTFLA